MELVNYQSGYQDMIEWAQVGNYIQSVCDKLSKIANLLPTVAALLLSTYTEVHIKQKFTLTAYMTAPATTY